MIIEPNSLAVCSFSDCLCFDGLHIFISGPRAVPNHEALRPGSQPRMDPRYCRKLV
jgi:hypothetical protein